MKANSRAELIVRYEKVKADWDKDSDLIRVLPDEYKTICNKLKGLKEGKSYTVTEVGCTAN